MRIIRKNIYLEREREREREREYSLFFVGKIWIE